MAKSVFMMVCVIVVGALIGSFLGQFLGMVFPNGSIHNLFAGEISAGLSPAHLDLRVIEVTFGCMLKFNMMSIVGIGIAAYLFRAVFK